VAMRAGPPRPAFLMWVEMSGLPRGLACFLFNLLKLFLILMIKLSMFKKLGSFKKFT